MHYANMDKKTAIVSAKACRPIIDPISHLIDLLDRFEEARNAAKLPSGRGLRYSTGSISGLIGHGARSSSVLKSNSFALGDFSEQDITAMGFLARDLPVTTKESKLPSIASSQIPRQRVISSVSNEISFLGIPERRSKF
jgi:hypothetical protein